MSRPPAPTVAAPSWCSAGIQGLVPDASVQGGPRWAVAWAAEGMERRSVPSHLWAGSFTEVRNGFTIARVPCQAVSSSLHPLTLHPASFFLPNPLIEPGWALPCLKLPRRGRPADKWVIGEDWLRCPGPQRVTPGWLAAHPQHLLLPRAGQQETADPSTAQRVAGPQPPVGI